MPVDVIPIEAPAGGQLDIMAAPRGETDQDGQFAVDYILPGRYVVAVNARFGPTLSEPYATTYFPGVLHREDAHEIELGEGERKTGSTFVVRRLAEKNVPGRLILEDGTPVADAEVLASPADPRGMLMASATTDSNGAFQLRLVAGLAYTVTVRTRSANGVRATEPVLDYEIAVFVNEEMTDLSLTIRA